MKGGGGMRVKTLAGFASTLLLPLVLARAAYAVAVAPQDGVPGPGVPTGGDDNDLLAKASGADFDTEWVDPTTVVVTDHGALTGLGDNDHPQYQIAATAATDAELAAEAAARAAADAAVAAAAVNDGDAAGGVLSGTYPNPGFAVDMATQAELDAHVNDPTDAHDAEAVSVVPFGSVAATNVQDALEEIVSESVVGAPSGADYLVGTAQGGLSAEIVAGTSPGGELGGTWASPTVDATHSGSSHAGVQTAAEATAAAALAAHVAADVVDGDAAGGVLSGTYPNPGFAVDMATQAELDAHVNDATAAHPASAIGVTPVGGLAADDVQEALAELDTEKAAASHAHAGEDITSGTVADARIASTITRDSELDAAIAVALAAADGDGLSDDGLGVLSVNVDGASIEINADVLRVKAGGIGANEIGANAVGSSELADDAVDTNAIQNNAVTAAKVAADVATQAELDAHTTDATDAHAGTAITNTPAGNLSATTAQGAINELDTEKTTAAAALAAAQTEINDQKRVAVILCTDPNGSALAVGDGQGWFSVPNVCNGHNLVAVAAALTTTSSSGVPTVQVANVTQAADMLSTKVTIDAGELHSKDASAAAVIDGANDDVAYGDMLRVDVDVAGTGAKGLFVILTFEAP